MRGGDYLVVNYYVKQFLKEATPWHYKQKEFPRGSVLIFFCKDGSVGVGANSLSLLELCVPHHFQLDQRQTTQMMRLEMMLDHTLDFDQSSREGTKTHDANAMLLNYDIYFVLFIVCIIFCSERWTNISWIWYFAKSFICWNRIQKNHISIIYHCHTQKTTRNVIKSSSNI